METLALKAVLSERAGEGDLALEQLGRAVSLAEPGGFIRVFLDIGPELIPMFNHLDLKGGTLQYVGRILAAFQLSSTTDGPKKPNTQARVTIQMEMGIPESLSRREKEVLTLLAERLSNKEIGERLFIATTTVKRHAQTIYEKLNVKGCRDAATKAIGLGLLSDKPNNSQSRD